MILNDYRKMICKLYELNKSFELEFVDGDYSYSSLDELQELLNKRTPRNIKIEGMTIKTFDITSISFINNIIWVGTKNGEICLC